MRGVAKMTTSFSAVALVTASAGFGAVYAWQTGSHHGPILGALSVLMALGLEAAKPFAIEAALVAIRSWSPGRALALCCLGTVAALYSLTAELSLTATIRADGVAKRAQAGDGAATARVRYDLAQRELEALPLTRPPATVAAEIERLKTTPKLASCDAPTSPSYGPVSRRVCAEIAALKAEAATSHHRERLQVELRAVERELVSAPTPTKADPAASALATYLNGLGVPNEPGTLSDWLVLVPVLALEVGSALAVVFAVGTSQHRGAERKGTMGAFTGTMTPGSSAGVLSVAKTRAMGEHPGPSPVSPLTKALLAHLKGCGGSLKSGQRGLARALGTSTSELHRTIHALAASGTISICATPSGTELRLATGF